MKYNIYNYHFRFILFLKDLPSPTNLGAVLPKFILRSMSNPAHVTDEIEDEDDEVFVVKESVGPHRPLLLPELQGGGIEKLVREKKLTEAKAKGIQRKKRELTDAEKAEKKRLRKGKKLVKKIKAHKEAKKSRVDEGGKKQCQ